MCFQGSGGKKKLHLFENVRCLWSYFFAELSPDVRHDRTHGDLGPSRSYPESFRDDTGELLFEQVLGVQGFELLLGEDIVNTKELAWKIRKHGIEMTHASGASHIGAILSVADIVAVLYGSVMKVFSQDPRNDLRDRFILSKGHAGAAVYAALAEMGFFGTDELKSYYSDGSHVLRPCIP